MTLSPSDTIELQVLCAQGLAHHRAGRLSEAAQCYEQVLAADPRWFDALHFLGVLRIQTGRLPEAVELIQQAVAVRGDSADAFGNLANALNSLGRFAEAAAAADHALALAPDFAQAHGNRGQALHRLGRLAEAADSYGLAAALNPTFQAFLNHAVMLRELGRHDQALTAIDQALALKPDHPEAWISRGTALRELGRPAEALASLDRAIALKPAAAETHGARGNALNDLDRHAEAIESYEHAIALRPDYVEALSNQSVALHGLGRHDDALALADRALAIRPDYAEGHGARASVLYGMRRLEDALEAYDQAVALRPDDPGAWSNRGVVLFELRRFDEAMASYDRAIALRPDFADAHHYQAMCRLMMGDYAGGWRQYEWRWKTDQLGWDRSKDDAPFWLGDGDVAGRTIVVRAEQGLGDALQFCRYVPDLAARGARVILAAHPSLERLLSRLDGVSEVVSRDDALPPHDLQVDLLSLPLALGAGPEPMTGAYLHPDPARVAAWAARLGEDGRRRIGLCWAGGVRPGQVLAQGIDGRRSLSLEAFAPLADLPGLSFYSLQKGPPAEQLAALRAQGWTGPEIIDLTADLQDFDETAALIANLDLVISCDTAVAHLAGGLGAPVWVLNRFDACWRWLDGRDDSPWYPSARLFRQPRPGDWTAVIKAVHQALSAG